MAVRDREAHRLMKEQSVLTEASVVEKFIAPDGRTHRIRYRVSDRNGTSDEGNVEVQPDVWRMLEVGAKVEAYAVPGRPDISRLALGQIDDRFGPEPGVMIWISVGIVVAGFVFFGTGIMTWLGFDLTHNSKHGWRFGKKADLL
jgi:hypothetical protein